MSVLHLNISFGFFQVVLIRMSANVEYIHGLRRKKRKDIENRQQHNIHLPRGNFEQTGLPAQGTATRFRIATYSPAFPVIPTSGLDSISVCYLFLPSTDNCQLITAVMGFRSHYGCGAAGDFHPSSSHPFAPAKGKSF